MRKVVVQWCSHIVVWWCGGAVVWWCGEMVVWWYGGALVWWCSGMVVQWCGGIVVHNLDILLLVALLCVHQLKCAIFGKSKFPMYFYMRNCIYYFILDYCMW